MKNNLLMYLYKCMQFCSAKENEHWWTFESTYSFYRMNHTIVSLLFYSKQFATIMFNFNYNSHKDLKHFLKTYNLQDNLTNTPWSFVTVYIRQYTLSALYFHRLNNCIYAVTEGVAVTHWEELSGIHMTAAKGAKSSITNRAVMCMYVLHNIYLSKLRM